MSAHLPAQTSPAGTFVEARSFPEADVFDFGPNVAPRLGISYDLFGNGRTALKAYYGRFYNQFGSQISEAANPNAHRQPGGVVDRHQRQPGGSIPGSWAPSPGSRAACSRPWTTAPRRPYSQEFNVGFSQELAGNMAVGGQLPPPRASQRARHPRPRPRLRRLHADRPHLRRSESAGRRSRSPSTTCKPEFITARDRVDQQRRVPAERLRRRPVRLPEADVEPLADAGRPEPAEHTRLRPQRHLHRRRLQQPELVDQPLRRLGVHRPAVGGDGVGQLPAPLGHHGLRQVHRAGRRPAQPHGHLLGAHRLAGQRDRPARASAARIAPRTSPSSSTCGWPSASPWATRRARGERSTSSTSSTPTTCCCRTSRSAPRGGGRRAS